MILYIVIQTSGKLPCPCHAMPQRLGLPLRSDAFCFILHVKSMESKQERKERKKTVRSVNGPSIHSDFVRMQPRATPERHSHVKGTRLPPPAPSPFMQGKLDAVSSGISFWDKNRRSKTAPPCRLGRAGPLLQDADAILVTWTFFNYYFFFKSSLPFFPEPFGPCQHHHALRPEDSVGLMPAPGWGRMRSEGWKTFGRRCQLMVGSQVSLGTLCIVCTFTFYIYINNTGQ